jgi:hypothetical protein
MWYHWIDMEQPKLAARELEDRHRRARAEFKKEEEA